MLRYVLLIWLCMSFNAESNEIDEPEVVVANFLSQMKVKDYIEASKYISDAELNWLFQVSVRLLRNPKFLGIYDLEALSQSEVKALGKSGVFELWSLLVWDARDKSFGSYQPQNILGTVQEGSASAYVVVRDTTHPHHEAMVYTLVLESNVWRLKLPRIIKGSVTLYGEWLTVNRVGEVQCHMSLKRSSFLLDIFTFYLCSLFWSGKYQSFHNGGY